MDDAEASIEVQAGQIDLKASQASLNALGNRVSSAETSITANANAIKLKASQSSVDSLEGRMDDAESEISQNASAISAKVSQTYGSSSSSFGWSLKSTGFYIYSNGSTVMKVTSRGLEISGAITAGSTITGAAINGGTIDIGDVFIVNEAGRVSIKSSAGNGNGIIRIDNYWIKLESGNSYMETTSTHVKVWDNSYVGSQGRNIVNYAELWGGKVSIYRDGVIFTLYIDGTPRAVCPHNLYITGTWTGSSAGSISSDRNKKNSITSMPIAYDVLFDELNPCVFKYNDGTSDRIHNGFIAQEVKNAMDIAGVSRQEFAALCIAYEGTEHEEWSLRYEEFVSMNTWQIQKLKQRVAELEARVAQLTNKE